MVQDAANEHRAKLRKLNDVLLAIASNPTVIDDDEFVSKLKSVQEEVDILLDDAKIGSGSQEMTPKERLEDFLTRLDTIGKSLNDIDDQQFSVQKEIEKADRNVSLAQAIIDEASKELNDALNLIKSDGVAALKRAQEKSTALGEQSGEISKISQMARKKADDIEKEIAELKNLTKQANSTADEAYSKTLEANNLLHTIGGELRTNIQSEMKQAQENLAATTDAVTNALKIANETYDAVLKSFANVNGMTLPEVNTEQIMKKTEKALSEANSLTEIFENTLDENDAGLLDYTNNLEFAKVLLKR